MGDVDQQLVSVGEVCPVQLTQLRKDLGPDAFAF